MDPKSCRQTPHWVIAMISSLFILSSVYSPCFVLLKKTNKKTCFWAECFMLHRWLSTTAWVRNVRTGASFNRNLVLQSPENATWGMCNVVLNYTVEYRPNSSVTFSFSCESWGIHICTEYSLLCSIWRAAVCTKVETAKLLGRCWTRGCRSWLLRRLFSLSEGTKLPSPLDPHMTEQPAGLFHSVFSFFFKT